MVDYFKSELHQDLVKFQLKFSKNQLLLNISLSLSIDIIITRHQSRKDLLLNISLLLLHHSKRCYKMIQSLYHECKTFVNEKYFLHAKINEWYVQNNAWKTIRNITYFIAKDMCINNYKPILDYGLYVLQRSQDVCSNW